MNPERRSRLPEGIVLSPTPNDPPPLYTKYPSTVSLPRAVEPPTPPSYSEATSEGNRSRTTSFQLECNSGENQLTPWETIQFFPMLACGAAGLLCFLAIAILIPASMTVVGGLFMFDCPANEILPVLLMLGGIACGIKTVSLNLLWYRKVITMGRLPLLVYMDHFCSFLFLLWFLTACIFLFQMKSIDIEINPNGYCNTIFYVFFFVYLSIFMFAIVCMFTSWVTLTIRKRLSDNPRPTVDNEQPLNERQQGF